MYSNFFEHTSYKFETDSKYTSARTFDTRVHGLKIHVK